jgi:hypothetical protein
MCVIAKALCPRSKRTFEPRHGASRQRYCCPQSSRGVPHQGPTMGPESRCEGRLTIPDRQKGTGEPCTPFSHEPAVAPLPEGQADPALLTAPASAGKRGAPADDRAGGHRGTSQAWPVAPPPSLRPSDSGGRYQRVGERGTRRPPAAGTSSRRDTGSHPAQSHLKFLRARSGGRRAIDGGPHSTWNSEGANEAPDREIREQAPRSYARSLRGSFDTYTGTGRH